MKIDLKNTCLVSPTVRRIREIVSELCIISLEIYATLVARKFKP